MDWAKIGLGLGSDHANSLIYKQKPKIGAELASANIANILIYKQFISKKDSKMPHFCPL